MDLLDTTDWRSLVKLRLQQRGGLQRELAQKVGRSGGWLSQVLSGRDLDPELVPQLAAALELDAETSEYLAALVDLHNTSDRAKRTAFAAVQAKQRQRASPELREEVMVAISRWYVPGILELASCEGFRMEPAWIGAILSPPVPEAEVQEALTALVRLGVLVLDEAGSVVARDVITPSVLPRGEKSDLAASLHRRTMELAAESLQTAHNSERHHGTMSLALSEEHFERIKARLREVEQELALLASQDPGPKDRVYQLQFQLFPLTLFTDVIPAGQSMDDSSQGPPPDMVPDTTV
jgi:uncharacterized protein (TIGR02147 family)